MSYNIGVNYEWFARWSHLYNYFVLTQNRDVMDVEDRIYTVTILGIREQLK
jgi:hypothetical protein